MKTSTKQLNNINFESKSQLPNLYKTHPEPPRFSSNSWPSKLPNKLINWTELKSSCKINHSTDPIRELSIGETWKYTSFSNLTAKEEYKTYYMHTNNVWKTGKVKKSKSYLLLQFKKIYFTFKKKPNTLKLWYVFLKIYQKYINNYSFLSIFLFTTQKIRGCLIFNRFLIKTKYLYYYKNIIPL